MNEWLLIIAMAGITFGIRYALLAASGRWHLPATLEQSLKFVPVAVLSAIVVQTIMIKEPLSDNNWTINYHFLLSALVAFITARLTNSLMFSVIAGLLAYWLIISLRP